MTHNDTIERAAAMIKQMQINMARELDAVIATRDKYNALIEAKSKPYDDIIREQTKIIEAEMLMLQESYMSSQVAATYRNGYSRISWNTEKLNGFFADKHVDVDEFRKVTSVDPTVIIKVL